MRTSGPLVILLALICLIPSWPAAAADGKADMTKLVPMLKRGGYVVVLRHGAADETTKDVYPFVFDDMTKQRQLSEAGRKTARDMGDAFNKLGIKFGQVYTSQLHRAYETGFLVSGGPITPVNVLTESGAGSAAAMANPTGANVHVGNAIRALTNKAPVTGANNLLVTHKPNIVDAFGKDFTDVKEAEALVYQPNASGAPTLIARVQASEWIAAAAMPARTN